MPTPIDREKMRSIGIISKRTRTRYREGKQHPETGVPWKATTDSDGNTVTEHANKDSRVDVKVCPATVTNVG